MNAAPRSNPRPAEIGEALTTGVVRRPRRSLAAALVLLVAALAAFMRIDPVTDVTQVVRTPAAEAYERAADVFGLSERAYVLIEAPAPGRSADLITAAERLRRELALAPEIARVEFDLPLSAAEVANELVLPFGPLYYPPDELDELAHSLSPAGLHARLEAQRQRAGLPGLGLQDEWMARDPLELHRPLVRRLGRLHGERRLAVDTDHFVSADGRALLVTAATTRPAASSSGARRTIAAFERAIATVAATPAARDLSFGITGAHALARESERVVRRDLTVSLSASIALALALLALALGIRARHVVWLAVPTLWGATVGIGAFVALEPAFTALSLGAAAILIGLGIDFTIHFVVEARARWAAGDGSPGVARMTTVAEAIEHAGRTVFGRLAFATATSSAAFLAFMLCEPSFLRDMGAIAVLGLSGCFAGAYLVLPPILSWILPRLGRASDRLPRATSAVASWAAAHARAVLAITALVSLACVVALVLRPPRLEDDLRNIHARNSRALAVQARIARSFGGSLEPLFVLVEGPDEPAVSAACQRLEPALARLRTDGLLTSHASPAVLVPPPDEQRAVLELLNSLDPDAVVAGFEDALADAGFAPEAFADYARRLRAAVARREPLTLAELRAHGLERVVDELARRGERGAAALVVLYPTRDPWSHAYRSELVERIDGALAAAGVTGTLTGLHQISAETATEIQRDFRRVLALTFGLVLVLMAARFRSPLRTGLVLVPTVLGSLWTAAVFGLADVRLNFMNLSVLPMVFAIGIDDGIHLLSCFLSSERRSGEYTVEGIFRTTGVAVVLTSLTTMVTFGSLSTSSNRGLASVGTLSFLGVGACLIASIVVLPALFHVLRSRRFP